MECVIAKKIKQKYHCVLSFRAKLIFFAHYWKPLFFLFEAGEYNFVHWLRS